MKPVNLSDKEANDEIVMRQLKLHNTIALADEKFNAKLIDEALQLYFEARHLSLYTGNSLIVRIMNEKADNELWHVLDKKIQAINSIITSTYSGN